MALALLGIALVSLVQLFSVSLRATKKSSEYTRALVYARSLMEEAYATGEPSEIAGQFEFEDGYAASREVRPIDVGEEEGGQIGLIEITVTVTWPPDGSTVLRGTKAVYEEAL